MARIAESGIATINEIETSWSFEDMKKAVAYIDMKSTIDYAIQLLMTPKE